MMKFLEQLYRPAKEHDLNGMGECRNYKCSSRLTQFFQVIPAKCNGFVPIELDYDDLLDRLVAHCTGMHPASDCTVRQVRIWLELEDDDER